MTRLDEPKIAVAGQERSDVEQLVADTVNNVDRMELELKLSGPVENAEGNSNIKYEQDIRRSSRCADE